MGSSKNTELSMYGFNSNSPSAEHILWLRSGSGWSSPRPLALMSGSWCHPSAIMPPSLTSSWPLSLEQKRPGAFCGSLQAKFQNKSRGTTSEVRHVTSALLHWSSHKANPASGWVGIDSTSPWGGLPEQHVNEHQDWGQLVLSSLQTLPQIFQGCSRF